MNTFEAPDAYDDHAERDYHACLEGVLDRRLTPENIDMYASQALDDLINLLSQITLSYESQPTIRFENLNDTEDAAMNYHDLQVLNDILDHVAEKEQQILKLAAFETSILPEARVFVSPDEIDTAIVPGNEAFQDKQHIARLKTMLFVLENNFSIDIYDPDRVIVSKGSNTPAMMRVESYYHVTVPELQRQVLVCDEEGNATYVFDSAKLHAYDNQLDVTRLTKSELNTLLADSPHIGKRLRYSKLYVEDMIRLLAPDDESFDSEDSTKYLKHGALEHAPDGYMSARALAKLLHISVTSIEWAVAACEEMIGEAKVYKFYGRIATGYSPDQQNVIRQFLVDNGRLENEAPPGVMSAKGFADMLGIKDRLVYNAVKILGETLGVVEVYRFNTRYVAGYTESQQKQLLTYLAKNGYMSSELSGSYLSIPQLADMLKVSSHTISRSVVELKDELGDMQRGRPSMGKLMRVLSPSQQAVIKKSLDNKGAFIEVAPEGYVACGHIAKAFDIDHNTASLIIAELTERGVLAEAKIYRFASNNVPGYSPEEQEIIRAYCIEKNLLVENAPADYLSATGMSSFWNLGGQVVIDAIAATEDKLGVTKVYRFGPKRTFGYSPEQQAIVHRYLAERGYFADLPPEGYLSIGGLARILDVPYSTVSRNIEKLGADLGDMETYRYHGRPAPSLDPSQQELISSRIDSTKRGTSPSV